MPQRRQTVMAFQTGLLVHRAQFARLTFDFLYRLVTPLTGSDMALLAGQFFIRLPGQEFQALLFFSIPKSQSPAGMVEAGLKVFQTLAVTGLAFQRVACACCWGGWSFWRGFFQRGDSSRRGPIS